MSTLNGILNFSGSEHAIGLDTIKTGDISVSVALDFIDNETAKVDVKLIGLTVIKEEVKANEDGSVSISGVMPNEGGEQ